MLIRLIVIIWKILGSFIVFDIQFEKSTAWQANKNLIYKYVFRKRSTDSFWSKEDQTFIVWEYPEECLLNNERI